MRKRNTRYGTEDKERGAVSLFLVIFFALLLGVITIGFINIIVRDSTQAVNSDLSQSAYDSAQAGVEDTKRALALYTNACITGQAACGSYADKLNARSCDTLAGSTFAGVLKLDTDGSSVNVQNSSNSVLSQAYTCVKVTLDTPDYINSKQAGTSDIIPLTSTSAFGSINLEWFSRRDAGFTNDTQQFTLPGTPSQLPKASDWGTTTPPIMRLELISYSGTITNTSLMDDMRTIFLYPSSTGGVTSFDLDNDHRSSAHDAPIAQSKCQKGGSPAPRYSCSTSISLGNLGTSAGKTMLLRVTPIYGAKTTFRLTLGDGANFDGVQPMVDSTGRSGDLFRRVQARVRLSGNVLYPEYALDVKNSICKTFSVGTSEDDFSTGTCN